MTPDDLIAALTQYTYQKPPRDTCSMRFVHDVLLPCACRQHNGRIVSMAACMCARLTMHPPEMLLRQVAAVARDMSADELVNVMWAFAKMNSYAGPQPPQEAVDCLRRNIVFLSPKLTAMAAWSLAKLDIDIPQCLHQRIDTIGCKMNARSIANVCWAYGHLHRQIPRRVIDRIHLVAQSMEPQGVSNTIWACAKTGVEAPQALLNALLVRASMVANQMHNQELANTVWACHKMSVPPPVAVLNCATDNRPIMNKCEANMMRQLPRVTVNV